MEFTMRALTGSNLSLQKVILPSLAPECLKIKVAYAGVNRADILQKLGKYPPPPGTSEILGLEVSGIVELIGSAVQRFLPGDRVTALLSGGGYSEYVFVEEGLCLNVPNAMSLQQSAAIPENWITAFQLLQLGKLHQHDSVLVHAAASGVGSALLQLLKASGCPTILAMVGTEAKMAFTESLGATHTFSRQADQEELIAKIKAATNGKGVSLILDCVGASVFDMHLKVSAIDARWILYGTLGGITVPQLSLSRLLSKRLTLTATTLRSRSLDYRVNLIDEFNKQIMPQFQSGQLKVQIDKVFDWTCAETALALLESNKNIGKVLLKVGGDLNEIRIKK